MRRGLRRICRMLLAYVVMLLACVAGMSLLGLAFPIANAPMVGVAVWFIFCFGSLCVPDAVWDQWLLRE